MEVEAKPETLGFLSERHARDIIMLEKSRDLNGSLNALEERLRASGSVMDSLYIARATTAILALETLLNGTSRRLKAYQDMSCKNCRDYLDIHCVCDGCCISENWFCANFVKKEEPDGEERS